MILKLIQRSIQSNNFSFKRFLLRCQKMLLKVLYFEEIKFIMYTRYKFWINVKYIKGDSIQCELKEGIN
jgi:hypothetical protein